MKERWSVSDRSPTVSTMYQREYKARTLSGVLRGKKKKKTKARYVGMWTNTPIQAEDIMNIKPFIRAFPR